MSLFTSVQKLNYEEKQGIKNAVVPPSLKLISSLKEKSKFSLTKTIDLKAAVLPEGIVLAGYYLGTFDFDSLTGHPGIRY